jgi:hypothetical protein
MSVRKSFVNRMYKIINCPCPTCKVSLNHTREREREREHDIIPPTTLNDTGISINCSATNALSHNVIDGRTMLLFADLSPHQSGNSKGSHTQTSSSTTVTSNKSIKAYIQTSSLQHTQKCVHSYGLI